MQTNRLIFINVDQSASTPQPSAITGFAVVKAPRGTIVPQFFPKQSTSSLLQWLGAPSSTYPGIQEVIDFNQLYGLWVSAPGGNVTGSVLNGLGLAPSAYPQFIWNAGPGIATNLYSYFGGVYVTTLGSLEPFYQVSEDITGNPVLNYKTLIAAGDLISPFSNTTLIPTYGSSSVTSDKLNNAYFVPSNISGVILTYPRSDGTTAVINYVFHTGSSTNLDAIQPDGTVRATAATVAASGTGYSKITFASTPAYVNGTYNDLNFTGALDTYLTSLPAGSISVQWILDITAYTIMALNQSSPRQYTGTFKLNFIDTRATVFATSVSTAYTVGVSSPPATAGNVVICGQTFNITGAPLANANALAAYLGTLTVPGYTFSYTSGAVFTVTTTTPSQLPPSLYIPPVGGLGGATFTPATTNTGASLANPNYNTMSFTYTETYYGSQTFSKTYLVSTNTIGTDAYGNNIYAGNVLAGNTFIQANIAPLLQFYNTAATISVYPGTLPVVWVPQTQTFSGVRAVASSLFNGSEFGGGYAPNTGMLDSLLQAGWALAANTDYQNTLIFFDPEADPNIGTNFSTLRSGPYQFSTFITAIHVSNGIPTGQTDLNAAVTAIVNARSTYPNLTGLAYYCNEFLQTEQYNGTSYYYTPIGSVASMLALIMDTKLGGAAPMFTNEGNPSIGGQLDKAVKKQKYAFDAGSLDTLDAAGVNPIILDPFYGLMITSQKTAQSPVQITDWSFLGHQMSFDLYRLAIKNTAMLPQIGKLIDTFHMNLRHQQVQTLLNARLTGPTAIWTAGTVEVETVNTADTKAQNIFVIKSRVKVTPFSEFVELVFINVGQQFSIG